MTQRSEALAVRLEQGARALATYARDLTDEQWEARIPHDGRKVGVVVHHVASMYPLEIQLAQTLARGEPIVGVTWECGHPNQRGTRADLQLGDERAGTRPASTKQRSCGRHNPGAPG